MIFPGATLGVLGGGQLGRMFALRARTMGYGVVVLDPDPVSPAGSVADHHLQADYADAEALAQLAAECDAITTEFENVPASTLEQLARSRPVRPAAAPVAVAQDRATEKETLRQHGFATARFRVVHRWEELGNALAAVGAPAILKTSRFGYDGKGQEVVSTLQMAQDAFLRFGEVTCVLEAKLHLEVELSVVLARGVDGEVAAFPVAENQHRRAILETSIVPARIPSRLAAEARAMACDVAAALDYVGVLGVELFVGDGGRLFVNEIAPRPHNSGHYTLDACLTDQFEQQVRTLCALPLGAPDLLSPVVMINLLGDLWSGGPPRWEAALALPGVKLHLYGKMEPRPGRKMGHLNCLASSPAAALRLARDAHAALTRK